MGHGMSPFHVAPGRDERSRPPPLHRREKACPTPPAKDVIMFLLPGGLQETFAGQ